MNLSTLRIDKPLTEAKKMVGYASLAGYIYLLYIWLPNYIKTALYIDRTIEGKIFLVIWGVLALIVYLKTFKTGEKCTPAFRIAAALGSILSVPSWLAIITTNYLFSESTE